MQVTQLVNDALYYDAEVRKEIHISRGMEKKITRMEGRPYGYISLRQKEEITETRE
jgi:hypothetical protein